MRPDGPRDGHFRFGIALGLIAGLTGAAWIAARPLAARDGACDPHGVAARRATYHLTADRPGSWHGVNDTQQVRVLFGEDRIRIAPLGEVRAAWDWALSLARLGTPGDLRGAASAWPVVSENRIDLLRGPASEWFVNGPKGLQHGLEILAPEGPGPFQFEFALAGTLTPKVAEDGLSIAFLGTAGAPVLFHRELHALDGEGRDVPARWERIERPDGPGSLWLTVASGEHPGPLRILGLLVTPKGTARTLRDAEPRRAPCPEAPVELAPTLTASGTLSPAQIPPANDLCAGAEVIPSAGPFPHLSDTHDLTDATTTGDPPLPSCQTNVSRSIWFRFTPAVSGSYNLTLCAESAPGSTLDDTVLAVYTATGDCAGFNEEADACDDDSCAVQDLQSVVSNLNLTAGTTYDIVVWEYGTTAPPPGSGAVQLQVSQNAPPGPAPANDRCGEAEVIPSAGPFPYLTTVTPDISGASTVGDPPLPSCQSNVSRSIWYSFTPATGGRYTFSVCVDAPSGSTVDDTVTAIYAGSGACSGLSQVAGACDDDSCLNEASQSVIRGVTLPAGTTYFVVVWQYGSTPPAAGSTAIQMRVSEEVAPDNDVCSVAPALFLDRPVSGTTVNAANDVQLPSGSTCFAGLGQTPSIASGGDVAYAFTAPVDGRYSFRATGYEATRNLVLYVASDCPAGPAPSAVAGCLGAANRNAGYPGEEVACVALPAGQRVYAYVDEAAATAGSAFTIEVTECLRETEGNDGPAQAQDPACGIEGSIDPAGEADFYRLGIPEAGSRVFALIDGAAANSTDFDLRVTTDAGTLEYDDLNNDTPFGSAAPNVAGTPLYGTASYLRVSHYSAVAQAEPYRLYTVIQGPPDTATREVEPNDTLAGATTGSNLYFAGNLANAGDVDLFAFQADAGDLATLGLDLDPTRDGTPFNGALALLDAAGTPLVVVNDGGSTSSTSPGSGLTATSPFSPGEAVAYRIRAAGPYYARVTWSSGTPGDYLLSVARNCRSAAAGIDADGDGVLDAQDCAPSDPAVWAAPGEATALNFADPSDLALLRWLAPTDPGGTGLLFDLLRSGRADDFAAPFCVARDATATSARDVERPTRVFDYLVRARNACGANLGKRSDGTPRTAGSCP